MHTIGLDAHSASFTIAVVNEKGKLCNCVRRRTSEEQLIEAVGKVAGPRQLVVEESHLAQWVKMTLEPYVDRLVVCDPRHNRWIAQDDFSDDRTSAIKLAQLLLGGYIKGIYHPDEGGAELRALFLHYFDISHQIARFKCKLKATFRRIGIVTPGQDVYRDGETRSALLEKLKAYPHLLLQANQLYSIIDVLEKTKRESYQAMLKQAKRSKAFDLIEGMPGAGTVITSGYIAMIVTPHRFSRENKLWRYAGFGNKHHESDDVVYKKGASKSGNRVLKWVVMQHFQGAVERSKKSNRFKIRYNALIAGGLDKRQARRQVCRTILSVVRAMWIKEESYRE